MADEMLPRPMPQIPKEISNTPSLWTLGLQFAYTFVNVPAIRIKGRRETMASKKATKQLKKAENLKKVRTLATMVEY
jgi:hypothetical protein